MDRSYKVIISGAVIGLILALSQPLYNLGILIFPGLVLFFLALKINKSRSFWLGYIAGLVYFLISFKWLWAVFPLKNYGIENSFLAFFLVLFIWIVTAGSLALTWGIGAGLWKVLDKKFSWNALLIFPAVFTVLEYLRSFLLGLVWIGKGTPVGPNWTMGNFAYNLHESYLALMFSSWFGIYGLTFLIIFLGLLLFIFFEKRKYKKFLVVVLVILTLLYWPEKRFDLGSSKRSNLDQEVQVAIIQAQIPTQPSYTSAEEASF